MGKRFNTMNIVVAKLDDADILAVNDFLLVDNNNLLYTSIPYLKLLKKYLNCDVEIIMAMEDNSIVGYFPLAFKTFENQTVCNSLPYYGSNGGMIVKCEAEDARNMVRSKLYATAYSLVAEKQCVSFTIISNPLDEETKNWLEKNVKYDLLDERIGQITQFSKETNTDEKLLKTFADPRPRNIRKAIKEGVKVYSSNSREDLDFLYTTHFENILAINGIPKEKHFFDLIPDYFTEGGFKVYIAEYDNKKIAALLLFYFNKTVEYYTPATIEEFRHLQPASLIIYKAMFDAINDGFDNWNWGGTWLSQGGVYDFKKKWGTTDHPYYYYVNILDQKIKNETKSFFLNNFPNFYVLPFNILKS